MTKAVCKNLMLEKTDCRKSQILKCKFDITSPIKLLYITKIKYTNYCKLHIK